MDLWAHALVFVPVQLARIFSGFNLIPANDSEEWNLPDSVPWTWVALKFLCQQFHSLVALETTAHFLQNVIILFNYF